MKPLTVSLVLLLGCSVPTADAQEKKSPKEPDKAPLKKDDHPDLKFDQEPEIAIAAPDNREKVLGKYLKPGKDEVGIVVASPVAKSDWTQLTPDEDVGSGRTYVAWPGCRGDLQLKGVKLSLCGNLPEIMPVPSVYESVVELHRHPELAVDLTLHTGRIVLTSAAEKLRVRIRFENPKVPGGSREVIDLTLHGQGTQVLVDRGGRFRPRDFYKDPMDPRRDGPGAYVGVWVMKGDAVYRHNNEGYTLTSPPGRASLVWTSVRGLDQPEPIKELPAVISFRPPMPEVADPAQRKLRDAILKARDALAREPAGKPINIRLGVASDSDDVGRRIMAVRRYAAIGAARPLLERLVEERDNNAWAETVKSIRHWITISRDNEYAVFGELQKHHTAGESTRLMELLDGLHNLDALVEFLNNPHLTIRKLAHLNLCEIEPAGKEIPYDATMAEDRRALAQQAWTKLLHKKEK